MSKGMDNVRPEGLEPNGRRKRIGASKKFERWALIQA